jgi:hypothetical protein
LEIAVAALHVEKVKEEPVVVAQPGSGKTERVANALTNFLAVFPAAMVRDAQS